MRRRHRASWSIFVANLDHRTYRTERKVYKILKQVSKDIKETANVQGNIDKNVFVQYCKTLWNTTNINESKLEWNSDNHIGPLITSDELEKALQLKKCCKSPGEDLVNSELYRRVQT